MKLLLGGKPIALGAIINPNGLILTKASELKTGQLACSLTDGREVEASLLSMDDENDVALVKISALGLTPVEWAAEEPAVGQWVLTPGVDRLPEAAGVISVPVRKLHKRALIGVSLDFTTTAARVSGITAGLGAEKAGLKPGDIILAVNDSPIKDGEQLVNTLRQFREGENVKLRVKRSESEFEAGVQMMVPKAEPAPDPFLFSGSDFRDLSQFADKLKRKSDPVSQFLWDRLPSAVRREVSDHDETGAERERLRQVLVKELNRILQEGPIYQKQRFAGVTLSARTRSLVNSELADDQRVRLNRLLLEDAFPEEIAKSPPPRQLSRQDRMNRMGGELSQRAEGFELAIQHDTVLQPWQCGGPLVNLDGKAVGLNIARAGRVASYALPAELVKRMIEDWMSP
ncbi:MAG: PDZ domain-containing protein [Verrucomicrobia bacterium]|nr:PDZ domain-containing protein [Verrucomicrobiota bacterium]